jgi:hypothetical protein
MATDAVHEYARCLLRLHELDPRGEKELPEVDQVCAEMDLHWARLTGVERSRVKGLSQDLYTLADGRKGTGMTPDQRREWRSAGRAVFPSDSSASADQALEFLRKPFPAEMPWSRVLFLQSRCWESLDDLDVALVFMQVAEQHDASLAGPVLALLYQTGRTELAREHAQHILHRESERAMEALVTAS